MVRALLYRLGVRHIPLWLYILVAVTVYGGLCVLAWRAWHVVIAPFLRANGVRGV